MHLTSTSVSLRCYDSNDNQQKQEQEQEQCMYSESLTQRVRLMLCLVGENEALELIHDNTSEKGSNSQQEEYIDEKPCIEGNSTSRTLISSGSIIASFVETMEDLTPKMITGTYANVKKKYHVSQTILGEGYSGIVRRCIDRKTKVPYAIKSIDKSKIHSTVDLRCEIEVLQELDHPSIIKLIDVFEDETCVHLITELCLGNDLYDMLVKKSESLDNKDFSERQVAKIIWQVLDAVLHCHERNIVHRDIKAENVMLSSDNDDLSVKLIDFGLSCKHESFMPMTCVLGTPFYIAPEVLTKSYDRKCDLWSIGVLTYTLLHGFLPFCGNNNIEVFASIMRGKFDFHESKEAYLSCEAKMFVTSLLTMDPHKRVEAKEAMNHQWFKRQLGTGMLQRQGQQQRHKQGGHRCVAMAA